MFWLRKIPVLRQMNAVECGAACLAMILSYYGRKTSVSEVRDFCGIERDGVSALALVKAAQEYGLEVKALSLQDSNLRGITLPAIVHWKFQHFLVVERWSIRKVVVIDPALGRRSLSPEEFDAAFTGVVIMLKPGKHFVRRSRAADKKLRTYVSSYLKYASQILLQVIAVSLLIQVFSLGIPFLTQMLVDEIIPLRKYDSMTLLGLGMIVFLLMNTIAMILRSYLLLYLQAHAGLSMTLDFFRHLLSLPLRFFQRRSNGDMLTRFGSDAAVHELLSSQLITTSLDSVLVLLSFIILLWQSPTFTLLVFGVGLLQILLMLMTHRALRSAAEQELDAQSKAQGYAVEALTGMATLKSIGAEKNTLEQWSKLLFEQVKASMHRDYLSAHIDITLSVLRICTPFLLLWYGALQVLSGQLSIGTMLALNALAINFLTPLSSLSNSGQTFQLLRSHLERIADVLDAESEQIQPVQPAPRLQGNITLKQVSFRYAPHSPLVLKEINMHIRAGQKVAIVGRTGSGKSTLGKLLLGLYLPTQGEILFDDNPLGSMQFPSVRAQFGTVIQESHIFSGSIRENIAFHRSGISMEHIMKASELAALHEDILSMPMHYETFVAEQGSALSGGQRQRLALARALVHNPSILLLDEATSHLDVITEQTIQRNLDALTCTRIIIAHRLSTIQDADLILLLEQGRIVEQGTHQDLLQKNGYYRRLVRQQLVLDDITEILPVVKYTRKPDAGNPVRPSSNGTPQSRDLEQIGADINSSGEEMPPESVRLLP